jgi:hypothetical protein
VLCVLFGVTSFFASWTAWREVYKRRAITKSILAAYNIAEDTLEKGRSPRGDFEIDPFTAQTVFHTLQEVLNAMYSDITGKPIPSKEERLHGSRKSKSGRGGSFFSRKDAEPEIMVAAPAAPPQEEHRPHA